ncbi:hypothetical protein JX266_010757 [Neoarthrinium moseri]|nr:hypothetical protein JX266_010757 [Neoarthrinium moseri]
MATTRSIAFITGANGGLGRAIAENLAAEHSYHTIIGSRDLTQGADVAASLRDRGFSASSVQLDLTSDDSICAAVKQIEEEHGKLDVLVNNAGLLLELNGISMPLRDLMNQTFQVNVFGTAVLTETCIPLLRKAVAPRVVFVGSVNGSITKALDRDWELYGIDFPAYKTSKAAMHMLAVRYVAKLEDIGGMVNVVCPGLVKTKMVDFNAGGRSPDVAALKVVKMATLAKGGPNGTFSNEEGECAW